MESTSASHCLQPRQHRGPIEAGPICQTAAHGAAFNRKGRVIPRNKKIQPIFRGRTPKTVKRNSLWASLVAQW